MTDIESDKLTIGTISVLRTLVELQQAGAIDLPVDDFVTEQRQKGGSDQLGETIEAIRGISLNQAKSTNN
jgi:hypothetical protein